MQKQAISVRQLNLYVKSLLEGDARLADVSVTGELSNFKNHYASGHFYFTLKDRDAAVRCVMFRSFASRVSFRPSDGMQLTLRGRISLYEKDGQYQFYVEEMQQAGAGDIMLQFLKIKERLEKEGLFDPSGKRALPSYPRTVAVVTSATGAAVQDVLNVMSRRWPVCRIVLCPVSVQGETAVSEMLAALDRLYEAGIADLIIIGRGGGSIEDLWAFNSEALARKLFESPVPVISAVGHETDFTICDFVADLRAPTPSAAAELAVPSREELLARLDRFRAALQSGLSSRYDAEQLRLSALLASPALSRPAEQTVAPREQTVDRLTDRLVGALTERLSRAEIRTAAAVSALDSLSPLKVLSRGYAVVTRNDRGLRSVQDAEPGDAVRIRLSDGHLTCTVTEKEKNL